MKGRGRNQVSQEETRFLIIHEKEKQKAGGGWVVWGG